MLPLLIFCTLDFLTFSIQLPIAQEINESKGLDLIAQGWVMSAFSILSFFCGPLLSRQSDFRGRVALLKLSAIGNLLGIIGQILSTNKYAFIAARILPALVKSTIPTAQAYLVDVSGADEVVRAKNFGRMGAFFGVAFIIGPLTGGMFASKNAIYAQLASAAAAIASLICLFFVPEPSKALSKKAESNGHADDAGGDIGGGGGDGDGGAEGLLKGPSSATMQLFKGRAGAELKFHFHNRFFFFLAQSIHQSSTVPFLTRLGSTSRDIGIALAWNGVISTLTRAILLGMLVKRFRNETLQMYSLFLMCPAWIIWPDLPSYSAVMAIACVLTFCSSVFMTVNKSQFSTCVPHTEMGAVMGISQSLDTLCMALAGPVSGAMFEYHGPKLVSWSCAVMVLYSAICIWIGKGRASKSSNVQEGNSTINDHTDGELVTARQLNGSVKAKVE